MAIFEIVFYRYLLCLPLLVLYGRWSLGPNFLLINNIRILILRSIFGFMGLSLWFLAIAHIDISLATALSNTMPIFIAILSFLIGKETVGPRRIIAVICGFGGVLVLLLPLDAEVSLLGTLYALSGAFYRSHVCLHHMLGKSDATISTAFGTIVQVLFFRRFYWPFFRIKPLYPPPNKPSFPPASFWH